MRDPFGICWIALGLMIGAAASPGARADEPVARQLSTEDATFFESRVRPILVQRCYACHGGVKSGGGLSLETAEGWRKGGESGPAIVPGNAAESLLIAAIQYESLQMPPADQGGQLPPDEIAALTEWVARGAPDPRDGRDVLAGMTREAARTWWSFQPLPQCSSPFDPVADARHVDELLQVAIARQQLQVGPPADRRTLLRRLSYDLTGLPPTQDEVLAFEADESPDAVSRVVERLLSSDQYGVQWGRHWLDVVRYADTAGENTDRPLPHAWRYRNWVIDAFNRDLPFDQFVRLQLAGDLLARDLSGAAYAEAIVATGYLAIARRFGHDIDKDMHLTHEDVIDNLGKNFLGLTLGCARCHNHKYDPVTAEDYYALYGVLESTRFAFPGCEPKGQPRDLVPMLDAAETEALMRPWRAKVAEVAAEKHRREAAAADAIQCIATSWMPSKRVLGSATVAEGSSVPFEQRFVAQPGELLLLTVAPNGSYGADSTLVELQIRESGGSERVWDAAELVPDLLRGNPWQSHDGAAWSFLEVTGLPTFLAEQRRAIAGQPLLNAWSLGSEPSVFANAADSPVNVWTSLPARTLFVHPGDGRPVAIAWTSPVGGELVASGRVADAHPAGGDGVSFVLEHLANPDLGPALAKVSQTVLGLPDAGPPPAVPQAYAVVDGAPKNSRFQERGDPEQLGAEVPRRWLTVFGADPLAPSAESGRRELAERVTSQPLLARVMVNRLWEWHFGRGLVLSSNDFGARGEPPSHPELLEFLASKFVQSGYSIKAMNRLLLATKAYQRASETPTAADPENRWLSHFARRRLTAEELRDSLLAASGQLDHTPGGPHPFPPEESWTFTQHAPFNARYDTTRRSAYLMVQRQRRHPFLALFDGADPNSSTPARQVTTVPTQALYFINDPFFHDQARALAAQTLLAAPDDAARADWLVRRVYQRDPSASERESMAAFLAGCPGEPTERWESLVRVLLASNEFLHVE